MWPLATWNTDVDYYTGLLAGIMSSQSGTTSDLSASKDAVNIAVGKIAGYSPPVKDIVTRAAWWFRQSQKGWQTGNSNPSVFVTYPQLWNAFEVSVEALCELNAPPSLSRKAKDSAIADFIKNLGRIPTAKDIDVCYRYLVNRPFRHQASHALKLVFGEVADQYENEIFTRSPKKERLYEVRNDIDHGNVIVHLPEERQRIEKASSRLGVIVLDMLCLLTSQSFPVDWGINACSNCQHWKKDQVLCSKDKLPADKQYWRFICDQYERNEGLPAPAITR